MLLLLYNVEMISSPAWGVGRQPPHPPGVPVLVADLLLHLRVGERLEEGRPRVGVALVAEGQLDDRQVVVAERVRLLVPRNLQKELLD